MHGSVTTWHDLLIICLQIFSVECFAYPMFLDVLFWRSAIDRLAVLVPKRNLERNFCFALDQMTEGENIGSGLIWTAVCISTWNTFGVV